MPHHLELASTAEESYKASRMAEAALGYRRAAIAALEIDDRAAWFKHLVWAANATKEGGDEATGLALLIQAREAEPDNAPLDARWLARTTFFEITWTTCPEIHRLRAQLGQMRHFASQHSVQNADIPTLEGKIHAARGDCSEALASFEVAWRDHVVGEGFIQSHSAEDAAQCCLRLGRFPACRDWISALETDGEANHAIIGVWQCELSLRLALAKKASAQKLIQLLQSYLDRTMPIQQGDVKDEARELILRVRLLDSTEGDPAGRRNTARRELLRRRAGKHDVHARYSGRLLFLDYRLACLRHAARVRPVEDFYYTKLQKVPARVQPKDLADFNHRLQKARAAANWAMSYARCLDGLLECDWRQREVQSRVERIEEIVKARH